MSDKKIVHLNNKKNMKEIIEAAKEEAEREFNKKLELSSRSDIDIREVFTAEEFDELCRRNEFFNGRKAEKERNKQLGREERRKKEKLCFVSSPR